MSTKKRGDNVISLHEEELDAKVWEHAINRGIFIPTTVDEVERMEQFLKAEDRNTLVKIPDIDIILSRKKASSDIEDSEAFKLEGKSYAIAARKGQVVSEEAKEKMERLKNSNKKKI